MNLVNVINRIRNKKYIFIFVILYLFYKTISYIIMDYLYDVYNPEWDIDFDIINLSEEEIIDIAIDLLECNKNSAG